jgi:hypothetical protein
MEEREKAEFWRRTWTRSRVTYLSTYAIEQHIYDAYLSKIGSIL